MVLYLFVYQTLTYLSNIPNAKYLPIIFVFAHFHYFDYTVFRICNYWLLSTTNYCYKILYRVFDNDW